MDESRSLSEEPFDNAEPRDDLQSLIQRVRARQRAGKQQQLQWHHLTHGLGAEMANTLSNVYQNCFLFHLNVRICSIRFMTIYGFALIWMNGFALILMILYDFHWICMDMDVYGLIWIDMD